MIKLHEHHQKRKVLINQRIYYTVQELCRNNETNQLCLIKFLHLLEPHIGFNGYISDTLMTIISKNEIILQSLTKCITNF